MRCATAPAGMYICVVRCVRRAGESVSLQIRVRGARGRRSRHTSAASACHLFTYIVLSLTVLYILSIWFGGRNEVCVTYCTERCRLHTYPEQFRYQGYHGKEDAFPSRRRMSLAARQPGLYQTTPHNAQGRRIACLITLMNDLQGVSCQPSGTYRRIRLTASASCPFERQAFPEHVRVCCVVVCVRICPAVPYTVDHGCSATPMLLPTLLLYVCTQAGPALHYLLHTTPRSRSLGAQPDLDILQTHVCCMHCEFPTGADEGVCCRAFACLPASIPPPLSPLQIS